jgi:hypothetical protein
MRYVNRLREAANSAIPALKKMEVDDKYTLFKNTMEIPTRFYPPSQSDSKFQAEQALGDWAEESVKAAINRTNVGMRAVSYGDNSKAFAEDEGFREAYIAGVTRTFAEGKRSDLLLLGSDVVAPDDCTNLSDAETARIVRQSIGGLEVRSSRLSVRIYKDYQKRRFSDGYKPVSMEPSITVKVEDLFKVYVWSIRNEKPQAYIQVFFDEVHGLSFLDILEYIGSAKLRVAKYKRSDKTTIMVPISQGKLVGTVTQPMFDVVHNTTQNGRHDIFAKPKGGRVEIDVAAVSNLLE